MKRTTVQLKILALLRPIARGLRALGLGCLVDTLKRRAFRCHSSFTIDVHGVRVSGATVNQLDQVRGLRDGTRDAYMTEIFERTIDPGMVVLDIGAYMGYFTLLAARRAGRDGTIVSFEPHPRSFQLLRQNVVQNDFGDRVILVQKALAATTGVRRFFARSVNESESGFTPSQNRLSELEVDCVVADAFLLGRAVDVVKIDVEGSELEVLRGMRQTLSGSAGATLFVEYNPAALRSAGTNPLELLELLDRYGYEAYVIDERARRLVRATADLPLRIEPGGYVDLFCTSRRAAGASG
jgi:FkbM family methyltransferase